MFDDLSIGPMNKKISQAVTGNHLLGDSLRFVLAGGLNTVLTLGVYQVVLFSLPHNQAYSISWMVGILFLLIVYPTKVFPGGVPSIKKSTATVIIYLTAFFLSLTILDWMVVQGLHKRLAIFVVLVVSTTLNFILMRLVYRRPIQ